MDFLDGYLRRFLVASLVRSSFADVREGKVLGREVPKVTDIDSLL